MELGTGTYIIPGWTTSGNHVNRALNPIVPHCDTGSMQANLFLVVTQAISNNSHRVMSDNGGVITSIASQKISTALDTTKPYAVNYRYQLLGPMLIGRNQLVSL